MFEGNNNRKAIETLKQAASMLQAEITAVAKEQCALRTQMALVERGLTGAGLDNESLASDVLTHRQALEGHKETLERLSRVIASHNTLLGEHREELDSLDEHLAQVVQEADERADLLAEIDVAVGAHEDTIADINEHLDAVGRRAADNTTEIQRAATSVAVYWKQLDGRIDGVRNATAADARAIIALRKDVDTLSSRLDALRDMAVRGVATMKESNDALLGLLYGVVQSLKGMEARTSPVMKETPAAKAKKWRKGHADDEGEAK